MNVQLTPRFSRHSPRNRNCIRQYRLKAGLSQRELGKNLGLGRNTVSSWERGLTCPTARILLRLAKLLSTLAEALYPDFYREGVKLAETESCTRMTDLTTRLVSFLEDRANAQGLAMARQAPLEQDLHCSRPELERALAELESAGKGRILSRLPFLAIRLTAWPNHRENAAKVSLVPYSYKSSLSPSRLNRNSHSHRDENKDTALLQEILDTLGETDPTTFRGALEAYSPAAIRRQTLEKIRNQKRVIKSRTALFRFLLPRIAIQKSA